MRRHAYTWTRGFQERVGGAAAQIVRVSGCCGVDCADRYPNIDLRIPLHCCAVRRPRFRRDDRRQYAHGSIDRRVVADRVAFGDYEGLHAHVGLASARFLAVTLPGT